MNPAELTGRITKAVAVAGGVPPESVALDDALAGKLGIDSLNGFELLCDLEEQLGIVIPDERARDIVTVRDVVDCIQPLLPTAP